MSSHYLPNLLGQLLKVHWFIGFFGMDGKG